ncbi:MAG: prolyl oligopeptidase family serine peptidase [bacterium]
MKRTFAIPSMLLLFFLAHGFANAQIEIDKWLVAGPQMFTVAVEKELGGGVAERILDSPPVDVTTFWPEKGTLIHLTPEKTYSLKQGSLELPKGASLLVAATYLEVPVWQHGTFTVTGESPFHMWLEGNEVMVRKEAVDSSATMNADTTLDQGKRRLLMVMASDGTGEGSALTVTWTPDSGAVAPAVTLDPRHPFDIWDYYLRETVEDLEISADGRMLATILQSWDRETDTRISQLQVWDTRKKQLVWEYRGSNGITSVRWSPDGSKLLVEVPAEEKGSDLLLFSPSDGSLTPVVRGLEDATMFSWSADGSGLFYVRKIAAPENEKPYKVMWNLMDRWPDWRDHSQIRWLGLQGNVDAPVWEGRYGPDGYRVTADGKSLILMRTLPTNERPYEKTEFLRVDLATGETTSLYTERFQRDGNTSFAVSPDGRTIAFVAGRYPVSGNDNTYPAINDADGDLWLLDVASGTARNVAMDFEPAISMFYYGTGGDGEMVWHGDGVILFDCVYNKKALSGEYDPVKNTFTTHSMTTPGAQQMAFATARGVRTIAYQGDVLNDVPDVWVGDGRSGKGSKLITLSSEFRRLIGPPAKVVDYDYVNSDGVTIPGYLFYPQDYDATKSYPMIVDFYGGVIGFGDGWEWNSEFYATRGYFVYIPVPRGAAGYGHEFANTHPNDWGTLSSRDINQGVRNIVAHVPGVDSTRVAPTSGSYGGYLTVYLLAMPKDDPDFYPYATGAAHAGIYDMAEYWGEGDWGFLYNDMAAAGSWPWNATDKYILWSPVYRADNITVPLLITHGDADNNVPPSNTYQLYTALEILNRNVWFLHWPDEDHGLAAHSRHTYLQSRLIRVEWFDKVLRDRSGAWNWRMKDEMKK